MSGRLIHVQPEGQERTPHTDTPFCWCRPKPNPDILAFRAVTGTVRGYAARCNGRGHIIVRWSDDGAPYYLCDRCYAELVPRYAA